MIAVEAGQNRLVSKLTAPFVAVSKGARKGKLLERLEIANHHLRNNAKTQEEKTAQKAEIAEISKELFSFAEVMHVPPSQHFRATHETLRQNEGVHPLESVEELVGARIGEVGTTKDCQLFYVPRWFNGPFTLSGVFRFHNEAPVNDNGALYANGLPSDVDKFKDLPPAPLTGRENNSIHLTISSNMQTRGSSDAFVKRGLADAEGRTKVTASPARLIEKFYSRNTLLDIHDIDGADGVREQVVNYLKRRKDPAGNLHMRNGAFLAWIGVNPESNKDPVIANYVYDETVAVGNAAMYAKGEIPMGEALQRHLGSMSRTQGVQSSLIADRLMSNEM